jgi:hypothetical protein
LPPAVWRGLTPAPYHSALRAPAPCQKPAPYLAGVYQMGLAHARSYCFMSTSGDIWIPKRIAS